MEKIKFEKMFWNSFLSTKWDLLTFEEKFNIAMTCRDRFYGIDDLKSSYNSFFWKEWILLFDIMFSFIKDSWVDIDDFTLAFIINETRHDWWDMIPTILMFFSLLNKGTEEILKTPF